MTNINDTTYPETDWLKDANGNRASLDTKEGGGDAD
jgi:hypothetical protein